MIIEICTDHLHGALAAQKFGAKRIELCSALGVGGLTPSFGLIQECAMVPLLEVHVMIRHREGNFCYDSRDISIMLADIEAAKKAGAHGVVFGCLLEDGSLDLFNTRILLNHAKQLDLEVTFHRAFDLCNDPIQALNDLITLKIDRLLTSGQQPTAEAGAALIKQLVDQAANKIEIMAGSGVNGTNAQLLSKTGVDAIHFTVHKKSADKVELGMGTKTVIDEEKITTIINCFH